MDGVGYRGVGMLVGEVGGGGLLLSVRTPSSLRETKDIDKQSGPSRHGPSRMI